MNRSENPKSSAKRGGHTKREVAPSLKHAPAKRRRRPRRKHGRAGGRWGDGFRDRLRCLISAGQQSQAAFAATVGVAAARVTEWLSGEQLPSAECLTRIVAATNVSLDWLFIGIDHTGQPTTSPVYFGQGRDTTGLEQDLAAAIFREVSRRSNDHLGMCDDPSVIDCHAVIQHVANEIVLYNRRFYATLLEVGAYMKFMGMTADLVEHVADIPESVLRRLIEYASFLEKKVTTLTLPAQTDCRFLKVGDGSLPSVEETQAALLDMLRAMEGYEDVVKEWEGERGIERINRLWAVTRSRRKQTPAPAASS